MSAFVHRRPATGRPAAWCRAGIRESVPRLSFSHFDQNTLPLRAGPRCESGELVVVAPAAGPLEGRLAARRLRGREDAVPDLLLARRLLRGHNETAPHATTAAAHAENAMWFQTSLARSIDDAVRAARAPAAVRGVRWEICSPAGDTHNIDISAGAEAAGLVLRHRALHRVEQILDALAAPRRHERVERERRNLLRPDLPRDRRRGTARTTGRTSARPGSPGRPCTRRPTRTASPADSALRRHGNARAASGRKQRPRRVSDRSDPVTDCAAAPGAGAPAMSERRRSAMRSRGRRRGRVATAAATRRRRPHPGRYRAACVPACSSCRASRRARRGTARPSARRAGRPRAPPSCRSC